MTNLFDENERDYLIAKITIDIDAIERRIKNHENQDAYFTMLLEQLIMLKNLLNKIKNEQ
jgi:hypothetical protein